MVFFDNLIKTLVYEKLITTTSLDIKFIKILRQMYLSTILNFTKLVDDLYARHVVDIIIISAFCLI